jgi:hypothetical protein
VSAALPGLWRPPRGGLGTSGLAKDATALGTSWARKKEKPARRVLGRPKCTCRAGRADRSSANKPAAAARSINASTAGKS